MEKEEFFERTAIKKIHFGFQTITNKIISTKDLLLNILTSKHIHCSEHSLSKRNILHSKNRKEQKREDRDAVELVAELIVRNAAMEWKKNCYQVPIKENCGKIV